MKKLKNMNKAVSIVLKTLVSLVIIALLFWFMLPPVNLRSASFWMFMIISLVIYIGVYYFFELFSIFSDIKYKTGGGVSFSANSKTAKRPLKILVISIIVFISIMIIGGVSGAPIFNAERYKSLVTLADGDFTADVSEISMSQIPVVDRDSASRLGKRKLGEMSDLVSQFEIDEHYTQINYRGAPVRVTPLSYAGLIKWFNNQETGLPAYITVDMVTQEANLVRLSEGMKYSPSEYFMRNLNRHLRFNFPTKIFDSISFEIDEEGVPYWVAPTISYKIGLWGGKDISGAVLVNAVTGESTFYETGSIPSWVDQVYISNLVVEQLNYNGLYQSGFWNSVFGQKGVLQTTDGYNYLAMGDDVYLYTGMTSVVSDESNVGFVLVNLRTKEAKFYPIPGAEEYSAMESAQGQVQHLNYTSTFPLLLNVFERPTYFLSLKDAAGLVKMYAFVDVEQYQIVGTGTSINAAREDYLSKLKDGDVDSQAAEDEEISGIVSAVSSAVIDGNTFYYILLENDSNVYSAQIKVNDYLPFLKQGDSVKLTYSKSIGARNVINIEIVK